MNRIPQYDYIKGFAIIMVIIHHALLLYDYSLQSIVQYTLGHAVPLFLMVTVLLYYTKYDQNIESAINYRRIVNTIVFPYVLLQMILIPLAFYSGRDLSSCLVKFGIGMGSYYVALFLQIIFLSKYMFILLKKNFELSAICIFLCFIISELFFVKIDLNQYVYRLLFTRYIFLFVIAYLLFDKDLFVKYRKSLIFLAIVGFSLQVGSIQMGHNYYLFPSSGFPTHKIYRDFITIWIFWAIWKCYSFFPNKVVVFFGKHSYNIFLLQMLVFFIIETLIR